MITFWKILVAIVDINRGYENLNLGFGLVGVKTCFVAYSLISNIIEGIG
jgi:hypothetical protein